MSHFIGFSVYGPGGPPYSHQDHIGLQSTDTALHSALKKNVISVMGPTWAVNKCCEQSDHIDCNMYGSNTVLCLVV